MKHEDNMKEIIFEREFEKKTHTPKESQKKLKLKYQFEMKGF